MTVKELKKILDIVDDPESHILIYDDDDFYELDAAKEWPISTRSGNGYLVVDSRQRGAKRRLILSVNKL